MKKNLPFYAVLLVLGMTCGYAIGYYSNTTRYEYVVKKKWDDRYNDYVYDTTKTITQYK